MTCLHSVTKEEGHLLLTTSNKIAWPFISPLYNDALNLLIDCFVRSHDVERTWRLIFFQILDIHGWFKPLLPYN